MKDNRFIELLNLYIDRQISAAETAELEAEMQASPRRRAVYRQYCQMHRATKSVYESFRASATEPLPDAAASRGVIANFESKQRHRRYRWVNYAGALAAAACLALVFYRFYAPVPQAAPAPEIARVEPAPAPAVVAPMAAAPEIIAVELPPGPTSLRNIAATEPNYAEMLRALREDDKRAYETGRILTARTPSLFDDGVFDSQPMLPAGSPRVYRSRQVPQTEAEAKLTAFQFQR